MGGEWVFGGGGGAMVFVGGRGRERLRIVYLLCAYRGAGALRLGHSTLAMELLAWFRHSRTPAAPTYRRPPL